MCQSLLSQPPGRPGPLPRNKRIVELWENLVPFLFLKPLGGADKLSICLDVSNRLSYWRMSKSNKIKENIH